MIRPWRLTSRAEAALTEIATWTIRRFGHGQAAAYEAEILGRCEMLARGDLPGQDCSVLAGERSGLRFIRAGRHFVIYTEIGDELVVIDLVHGRADLPRRLKALIERESAGHLARLVGPEPDLAPPPRRRPSR